MRAGTDRMQQHTNSAEGDGGMAGALEGQVAVVTGSSRGIGRACAIELARHGASVVVNYVGNREAAEECLAVITGAGGKGVVIQADVSKAADAQRLIDSAIAAFGKVDILVNNAGINRDRTISRMSVEEWDEVIQTDLSSMFYCTRAAVPGMRERNHGRIINMSSIIGQMGNVGQANYAAAKAGMIAFTKTAAKELARNSVTVNAVCPGFVETEMVTSLSEEVQNTVRSQIPLGRFGTAEEIAALVRFLCAEGAWITGQQLSPNGGQYM
jgi:acetoacetyl-CoA reductase